MANEVYSQSIGAASPAGQVSIDDRRRVFNFGERVAELNPASSPFFAYLSKVAKKPTDDPVFKFLEKRHQWQRRNFKVETAVTAKTWSSNDASLDIADNWAFYLTCDYDKYGRVVGTNTAPEFLTPGQVIAVEGQFKVDGSGSAIPVIVYYKIATMVGTADTGARKDISTAKFIKMLYKPDADSSPKGIVTADANDTLQFAANAVGQVIGSAWAEGTGAPEGFRDEFYSEEGYCQIFKTAVPLFSGTALATRYRGDSNEYMRVYKEKLMEHKMDIENALLFGYGLSDDAPGAATASERKTWGILPYTEIHGKIKNFTYASSGYDDFVDAMSDLFDAESGAGGSKLVLASRAIMNWLNKLGGSSFLGNTMASGDANSSAHYGVQVSKDAGMFQGVQVTKVSTLYGTLNFVMEPLLRGPWANHAIVIDLKNVAYRPLVGNGVNRDTHIMTNIQLAETDGRKDMILTEAGLEISLSETHAILNFNT